MEKKMKHRFAIAGSLLSALAVASAAPLPKVSHEALREAMSDTLKDAESARFKDIKLKQDKKLWLICGYVNAKNSYGGYAGFSQFFAIGVPSASNPSSIAMYMATTIGTVAEIRCSQEGLT